LMPTRIYQKWLVEHFFKKRTVFTFAIKFRNRKCYQQKNDIVVLLEGDWYFSQSIKFGIMWWSKRLDSGILLWHHPATTSLPKPEILSVEAFCSSRSLRS
jgi:hypothetical protein